MKRKTGKPSVLRDWLVAGLSTSKYKSTTWYGFIFHRAISIYDKHRSAFNILMPMPSYELQGGMIKSHHELVN